MINGGGSDDSIYFSTAANGLGNQITNLPWSDAKSFSTFGNPGNISIQQYQEGDNIFVYQPGKMIATGHFML